MVTDFRDPFGTSRVSNREVNELYQLVRELRAAITAAESRARRAEEVLRSVAKGRQPEDYGRYDVTVKRLSDLAIETLENIDAARGKER